MYLTLLPSFFQCSCISDLGLYMLINSYLWSIPYISACPLWLSSSTAILTDMFTMMLGSVSLADVTSLILCELWAHHGFFPSVHVTLFLPASSFLLPITLSSLGPSEIPHVLSWIYSVTPRSKYLCFMLHPSLPIKKMEGIRFDFQRGKIIFPLAAVLWKIEIIMFCSSQSLKLFFPDTDVKLASL